MSVLKVDGSARSIKASRQRSPVTTSLQSTSILSWATCRQCRIFSRRSDSWVVSMTKNWRRTITDVDDETAVEMSPISAAPAFSRSSEHRR